MRRDSAQQWIQQPQNSLWLRPALQVVIRNTLYQSFSSHPQQRRQSWATLLVPLLQHENTSHQKGLTQHCNPLVELCRADASFQNEETSKKTTHNKANETS